jgi:hypothetical protein
LTLIQSADIDARLKMLFDALKVPNDAGQLGGYQQPEQDEDPFCCLLEDDQLITHVSVKTGVLLEPTPGPWARTRSRMMRGSSLTFASFRTGL